MFIQLIKIRGTISETVQIKRLIYNFITLQAIGLVRENVVRAHCFLQLRSVAAPICSILRDMLAAHILNQVAIAGSVIERSNWK